MADFIKREKGEKLLKKFRKAVTDNGQLEDKNPLYERVLENRRYHFEIEKPIEKLFKLLNKHNGYGEPQMFPLMKRDDREQLDGKIRTMLLKPAGIETLDIKMLNQLFFVLNRSKDSENRLIAEKISDGTLVKILERALELGSNKDTTLSQSAEPAPSQP